MKYSNTIEYNISTKIDKSGLGQLQTQIKQVELEMQKFADRDLLSAGKVEQAKTQLQGLSTALNKSFDSSLGMLDLGKFREELNSSNVSAEGLQTAFQLAGAQGSQAFADLATQIGHFNTGMEASNSQLDKLFVTFSNTFRWGVVSSFFSQFMNAIHSSVDYVKELDDSLTQIMLVTDYNRDSMNEYAKSANEAAKALSMSTVGMTNASLVFAQQGYDLEGSQQLAELSAKLANASQQDTATTSDQITAYMNAYGLGNSIEELTQQMDNWALIANVSAADVSELAEASQRAASMANAVGVSGETLAAQIATIESVTREAPEQIGNGLKTLYARFSDLSLGKEDEDGVGLGKVTATLQSIGVDILDQFGQVRDMDSIIEDLMDVWADLDQTAKLAAAQSLAGKYQVNRFFALMDNRDLYEEYAGATGSAATGTLDEMNQEYAESLVGRTQKLQTTLEGLFNDVFTTDMVYPAIDALTKLANAIDMLFKSVGGGPNIILGLASAFGQLFSSNIARQINDTIHNQEVDQLRASNIRNVSGALEQTGLSNSEIGQYINSGAELAQSGQMNGDQYKIYTEYLDNYVISAKNAAAATEQLAGTTDAINAAAGVLLGEKEAIFEDLGELNFSNLIDDVKDLANDSDKLRALSAISFKDATDSAENFAKSLGAVGTSMSEYMEKGNNGDIDLDKYLSDTIHSMEALDDLKNSGALTSDEADKLATELSHIYETIENGEPITREQITQLDQSQLRIARLSEALQKLGPETLMKGPEAIRQAILEEVTAIEQEEQAAKNAQGFLENMGRQNIIQDIVQLTASLGQLAFSWQAFQNLGSIWHDDDLTGGEKVLQTVMAMSSAIGSLIPVYKTFGNIIDKTKASIKMQQAAQQAQAKASLEAAAAQEKQAESNEKNAVTETVDVTAESAETKADKAQAKASLEAAAAQEKQAESNMVEAETATVATGATNSLSNALKALGIAHPWLLAVGLALGALAIGIGEYRAQAEEAREEAQKGLQEAQQALTTIQDLKTEISDFRDEIQDFTEDFESLADKAEQIIQSFEEMGNTVAAQNVRLAATRAAAKGTAEGYEELANAMETSQRQAEMDANTEIQKNAANVLNANKITYDAIEMKQRLLKNAQEELNAAQQKGADTKDIEQRVDALQKEIDKYSEVIDAVEAARMAQAANVGLQIGQENAHEIRANGVDEATRRAGTEGTQLGSYDFQSLDRLYDKFVDGWDLYSELEKIDIMMQTLTNDADKAEVQVWSLLTANQSLDREATTRTMFDEDGYRYQQTSLGMTGIQDYMQQSGLTAEQQVKILGSLDDHATEEEILAQIDHMNQVIADNKDFDLELKASVDPEQFRDMVKNQLANYEPTDDDVDADDFKTMSNMLFGAENQMGVEGTSFEDYSPDLLDNADALETVIEAMLRYDDAVQTLDKNLDSWKETLNDTNQFSKEHIDAVQELQETYADFLNLVGDMDVSEDFASNADNLELMEKAANGVEEAYDDLQKAAAADLYMQITGIEDLDLAKESLQSVYDELEKAGFYNINIGDMIDISSMPTLNTAIDEFLASLDGLGLTAEQAAAMVENAFNLQIPTDSFVPVEESAWNAAENAANAGDALEQSTAASGAAAAENLNLHTTTTMDTQTVRANDATIYTNLDPQPGSSIDIESTFPVGSASPTASGDGAIESVTATAHVQGVTYDSKPVTVDTPKDMTGSTLDVKAEQGSGNSGFRLKNSGVKGTRTSSPGAKSSGGNRPSSSTGGGKGSCFIAGTLVHTFTGLIPIEQIQVNDIVLSYSSLGLQYSTVAQTMIHHVVEPIYTLYIQDEQLRVTGNHPFYISRDFINFEWIEAQDLQIGDIVLLADGSEHLIWKIKIDIKEQTVYNFEVDSNHNYFVGRNGVLVHNKGGSKKSPKGSKGKEISTKDKKTHEKDYYEEVDSQLKKVDKVLDGIQKKEDKLIGDKARANQNKQLKLLEKEIGLQQDKLKILTEQEKKDVETALKTNDTKAEKILLKRGITSKIPNPIYDEDGMIANYEEMSKAIDDAHNKLIDKYNAAAKAGNEKLTKQLEKDIKKFDEYGENILKNAKRSNEIQTEIEEIQNTIDELKDSITNIRIEAYKAAQQSIDKLKELGEKGAEIDRLFRDFNPKGWQDAFSLDDNSLGDLIEDMSLLDNLYNVSKEDAEDFYQTLIDQKKAAFANAKDDEERNAIQTSIDFFTDQKNRLKDGKSLENGQLGLAMQDLERLQGWIDGTSTEDNPFGDNVNALWEAYEDAYNRTLETMKDARKVAQQTRDDIINYFDDQEDALDRIVDHYDRISDHLQTVRDTYTLYYGEDNYDQILQISQQQGATLEAQLQQLRDTYSYWQDRYKEAVATGDETLAKAIEEKMNDAEDAIYDKAEELAEHWVEHFETSVDSSIQKMTDKLWGTGNAGGNDFSDQQALWELQKDYMQTYKDDVEKAYEMDKLRNKYINMLNDAQGASLQTQNKIRAQMQEQLDYLNGQNTLSEYDVKLANAKLEILQKQIALEDAQRNKNKMQLRRDTQGNYRYVYTAEQGDVQKAQEELTDSEYDAYEMTKQQTIANNDRAINLYNDYVNKIREISIKYKDDEAARMEALANLSAEYSKLMNGLKDDYQDTTEGMYDILTWLVENGTDNTTQAAVDMLDTLYDENGKVKEQTGQDWMDLATKITKDVLPQINSGVGDTVDLISTAATNLKDKMTGDDGALTVIGAKTEDLTKSLEKAEAETKKWTIAADELWEAFAQDDGKVQEAMKAVEDMTTQLSNAQNATSQTSRELNKARSDLNLKTEEAANYKTALGYAQGSKIPKVGDTFKIKEGTYLRYQRHGKQYDDDHNYGWKFSWKAARTPAGKKRTGPIRVKVVKYDPSAAYPFGVYAEGSDKTDFGKYDNSDGSDGNSGYGPTGIRQHQYWWFNQAELQKMVTADTGGYTGEWNEQTGQYKNGKMALLHQKELILNATDTENILSAVELMRNIVQSSKFNNNWSNALNRLSTSGFNDTVEQRVEISATFPNATDAEDIRQALIGLSDKAYQYAHRTI